MESDVSDDDSDSPSIDELLDLVHEHQKVIKKQSKEIKNLSALKDINASLATNFENLMCKFNLLSKEHEEHRKNQCLSIGASDACRKNRRYEVWCRRESKPSQPIGTG